MQNIKGYIRLYNPNINNLHRILQINFDNSISEETKIKLLKGYSLTFEMLTSRLQSLYLCEAGFSLDIQSQRYNNYKDSNYIISGYDKIVTTPKLIKRVRESLDVYNILVDNGIDVEDARQVLPLCMPCYAMMSITADKLNDLVQIFIDHSELFQDIIIDMELDKIITRTAIRSIDDYTVFFDNMLEDISNTENNIILDEPINAALSALTCTNSLSATEIEEQLLNPNGWNDKTTKRPESVMNFVAGKLKHVGILEKIAVTTKMNTSIACYNQLVRHRISNFIREPQSKTIYHFTFAENALSLIVDNIFKQYKDMDIVTKGLLQETVEKYLSKLREDIETYSMTLVDQYDDILMQFIPIGHFIDVVLNDNLANICHVGKLRLCNRAQKEARDNLVHIYNNIVKENSVYGHILTVLGAPACIHGKCPEGKGCCGDNSNVRKFFEVLDYDKE